MGQTLSMLDDASVVDAKSPAAKLSMAIVALMGGVANLAELTALSLTSPRPLLDGAHVWVESVRDYFMLRTSPAAALAGKVVASSVAGRMWFRRCIPDPSWESQAVWEINSNLSVENDGLTPGTSIPYHEFMRRRATVDGSFTLAFGATMTININADMPSSDPLLCRPRLYGSDLRINGVPSVAFAAAVTAKTDLSTAGTGTSAAITCTGWTVGALLNKPVKDTTNNRWAWIAKDNGAGSARVCNWQTVDETVGVYTTAASAPATTVGAAVEVYTLPTIAKADIAPQGAARLVVNKLNFAGTIHNFFEAPYQLLFNNCDFSGVTRFASGSYIFDNCRHNINGMDITDGALFHIYGGLVTMSSPNATRPIGTTFDLCNHVLFQGVSLTSARNGILRLRNVFFEDVANPVGFNALITVQVGSQVYGSTSSTVRGNGNTCNVLRMDSYSRAQFGLGFNWTTVFSVATTAHNGIIINGTAAGAPVGATTTSKPLDPATWAFAAAAISMTFANLQAAYSGGTGFGGVLKDMMSDVWAGA